MTDVLNKPLNSNTLRRFKMASLKAIIAMAIFSAVVFFGMNAVGLQDKHNEPLFALAGAIVLLIALVINVTLYLKIAGEAPFKWFND